MGNQALYREIRDDGVKPGETPNQFYARLKLVLDKPPKAVKQTASGREVLETADKKDDNGGKSDKPEPPSQPEPKSTARSESTPPLQEIVSKSPSVSNHTEKTAQSDVEMASTEVNSAKS